MKIQLRDGVKFHDGSPVTATAVVKALNEALPPFMGPAFDDVEEIITRGETEIDISLRRPSPFLLEALEAPIRKPGSPGIGTGPYMLAGPEAPNEIRANAQYYLGAPTIDRIVVTGYPDVRSAWAEMLRNRIDFLFEVSATALDSLSGATNVSVFSHVRHYQYVLIFNASKGPLHSKKVRQALNQAIDPTALIRDAFDGHAAPSSGLIWPNHWAFSSELPRFSFDPQSAAAAISANGRSKPLRFKCLVRPDLERVALVVKRQLEAVGVEMSLEEGPFDTIVSAIAERDFDAVLIELISGPSLFRPYLFWHSGGTLQPSDLGSHLDAFFDRVRFSKNEQEYATAVGDLQRAAVEDPPGIFLAWVERSRAVSKRFNVAAEPGRDILTTLRLWRPIGDEWAASASRN